MSTKIEVLCPNGHRVTVKTQPNTKILQILEEACTKKGFHPPEDYELRHGRKALDVTLSVRYAGLPNLAKLELVKSSQSRVDTSAVIALQLEDGRRLQKEFQPNTTLWEILQHWQTQPDGGDVVQTLADGVHPVCIYMREEVIGEYALRETNLRSLGLTGGRSVIRLVHRAVDDETILQIVLDIEKEHARKARIAEQSQAAVFDSAPADDVPEPVVSQKSSHHSDTPMDVDPRDVNISESTSSISRQSSERSMEVDHSHSAANIAADFRGAGAAENVPQPGASCSDPQPSAGLSGGEELAPGITLFRPGQMSFNGEQEQVAQQLARALLDGSTDPYQALKALQDERKQARRQREAQIPEFKFPEETKGKSIYKNEHSDVNKEEYKACDREVVVYNLDDLQKDPVQTTDDDVPDEFFQINESDIRRMWQELQQQNTEDAEGVLMTQSMRRSRSESRMALYTHVALRIHFPDHMVLQGIFRPRETVHAVKKFVKDHLEDKKGDFYLYTTPPRCVLQDEAKTLIQCDLVPMSVVYFGCDGPKDHYLDKETQKSITSHREADGTLVKHMPHSQNLQSSSESWTSLAGACGSSAPDASDRNTKRATDTSTAPIAGGSAKLPKWFKAGKKS